LNESPLEFTGERFTPECVREIWYEHWHRYALAARIAAGRRVLDAACGEGYGSALLARSARSVLGVDVAAEAVAHARNRYTASNLSFEQNDATALDALPDASFDLIVSFETLEHVHGQERMVAGFARLLAPGGVLLISSPDKATYTDATGAPNPHHVRELYRPELEALLAKHFAARALFGQKLLFQSVLWPVDRAMTAIAADTATGQGASIAAGLGYAPLYFIAACAREAADLPAALDGLVSLFGDREESVYSHYNGEVRRNMAAGGRIAELEREVEALRAALAARG
jgi:2-polyprenyl-3-methyl-5-hydroxy-6-metoxy-1,4-benzoquinol methylase